MVLCCRTSGGFLALSPISPQELLLQPMTHRTDSSEDNDASQVLQLLPIEIVDRGGGGYSYLVSGLNNTGG